MNDSRSGYAPPYVGGENTSGAREEDEDVGMLSSAMKLAKAAGERLSAAESEVWKRINGGSQD